MPMGAHDLEALSSQAVTEALARMIQAGTELVAFVSQQAEAHRATLPGGGTEGG
jgi:hypothetical protein